MELTKQNILELDRVKRLNMINSLSGIKPANLIGTISNSGKTNLAIFNSVVHLNSNPPLIGFILRPHREIKRHTYENILEKKYYTINHIHKSFIKNAHYTSAKLDKDISEFEVCNLTPEYLNEFSAPFVKESKLKMGVKFLQQIPIEINNTSLIIGEVELLIVPENSIDEKGQIDLSTVEDVGISGLNTYYAIEKIGWFPYARPEEIPDF